eukprot:1999639-Amphidinium_carterae.1
MTSRLERLQGSELVIDVVKLVTSWWIPEGRDSDIQSMASIQQMLDAHGSVEAYNAQLLRQESWDAEIATRKILRR